MVIHGGRHYHVRALQHLPFEVLGQDEIVLQLQVRTVLLRFGTDRNHNHRVRLERFLRLRPSQISEHDSLLLSEPDSGCKQSEQEHGLC